jgi:hypothetical protein
MFKKKLFIASVFTIVMGAGLLFGSSVMAAKGIVIPPDTGLSDKSVEYVLNKTLNWLLTIFVILATIAFVITGLQFIFSFGGASGTEADAKKNFVYTIIAILIVGGALIILNTVIGLLGPGSSNTIEGSDGLTKEDMPHMGF